MTNASGEAPIEVRPSRVEDRRAIYDILIGSGLFGVEDAEVVDEMFADTWDSDADAPDSTRWLSCWHGGRLVGFACFGPESLTKDTWDLFWVCVVPDMRGRGAGRALMAETEQRARAANARVMVIYTSSAAKYAAARRLYAGAGFLRAAVVPDYYDDGDDLEVYWKRLSPGAGPLLPESRNAG